jgi:hypothetical protein
VRAVAWALAIAWATASSAWAGAPVGVTRVTVEVFSVGLDPSGGLVFARQEGELRDGANPDGRARSLSSGETALLHSTSWRWEPDGRIVLTYLAWAKDGTLVGVTRPLPKLEAPAATDPLRPRPAEVREVDPLAHGLRHLSFLLRTDRDGAVAKALGPRAAAALGAIEAGVAGELPQ